ncbi:MAG: lanthionine synthetase LanC family protein [Gemmatimonadota bacterium]
MCTTLDGWTRRDFVRRTSSAAALGLLPGAFRLPSWSELGDVERPHLEVALSAWRWIQSARVVTDHGVTWPADPDDAESVGWTLYSHSPGVLLFALELFHATKDEAVLDEVRKGADHLAAYLDDERVGAGLYTGLAGLSVVFQELHRASGDPTYRELTERALERIVQLSEPSGSGVAWPQPGPDGAGVEVTDIVSGAAGTGLGLLWLHDRLGAAAALDAAVAAGHRLVEQAEPVDGKGLRWQLREGYPREYPNFSHGTGGVAYFLATLHERTGERAFETAATRGARYLQSIARVEDGGYRIFHYTPDGENRYYLSWCHGPVGTNRLFHRLGATTGDVEWQEWTHMGAQGIMGSGVPERRTPGFWENISQCCGDAGLGELFLTLQRMTGRAEYGAYVERLNASLLGRSTKGDGGIRWIQAEHRARPDLLVAQTGFMQGAAGVGKYFLHVDRMEESGEGPRIVLPDSPY